MERKKLTEISHKIGRGDIFRAGEDEQRWIEDSAAMIVELAPADQPRYQVALIANITGFLQGYEYAQAEKWTEAEWEKVIQANDKERALDAHKGKWAKIFKR